MVYKKIDACKYFAKFTSKQLYQRLFLNKVACLRSANLLKRDSATVTFLGIIRNTIFYRTPPVAHSVHRNEITEIRYFKSSLFMAVMKIM